MSLPRLLILLTVLFCTAPVAQAQNIYEVRNSTVSFNSNAPNEVIQATSKKLKGLVNTTGKQFGFKIEVVSFEGFNSPLQQEHFNENYMESAKYPQITYSGKIIEDINLLTDGKYTVRAKGKLTVHGVSMDRIIYVDIMVKKGVMDITSKFKVALADHDIKIPRIVNDKLATEVFLEVKATLVVKK